MQVLSQSYVAQAIAHEAIRSRPVVAALWRKALKDVDLKAGLHIPEGTQIWALMRQEIFDANAGSKDFDPEQWLDFLGDAEDISSAEPVGFCPDKGGASSIAFGLGARRCLGENLALAELTALVAMLSRRVQEVQVPPEELKDNTPPFSEHPTGLPVKFVPREA